MPRPLSIITNNPIHNGKSSVQTAVTNKNSNEYTKVINYFGFYDVQDKEMLIS